MHKGRNKLGGTIISPYHIITAAHGFVRYDNSASGTCRVVGYRRYWSMHDWTVAFGDDCIRTPLSTYTYASGGRLMNNYLCNATTMQFRRIRAVMVDRGFADGGCMSGHDWAIVELDRPILFDERVRPICLPHARQPLQNVLKAVGWGKPQAFIQGDPEIREIPLRHNPNCEAPHGDSMPTKAEDYVCAKTLNPHDRKSPRSCYGDSGSGLEQRGTDGVATLIGVTSFGTRGCPPNELGRFTSVEKHLDPICKHTGPSLSEVWLACAILNIQSMMLFALTAVAVLSLATAEKGSRGSLEECFKSHNQNYAMLADFMRPVFYGSRSTRGTRSMLDVGVHSVLKRSVAKPCGKDGVYLTCIDKCPRDALSPVVDEITSVMTKYCDASVNKARYNVYWNEKDVIFKEIQGSYYGACLDLVATGNKSGKCNLFMTCVLEKISSIKPKYEDDIVLSLSDALKITTATVLNKETPESCPSLFETYRP